MIKIGDEIKKLENQLLIGALKQDPRIAQAKQLLRAALQEQQNQIVGVRPPSPGLRQSYQEVIAEFERARGRKLYYPYIGSGIGKGALVELLDGSIKYDFITGIGVHYWGHSNLEILDATIDAALTDTTMQGNLQQNGDTVELSELLTRAAQLDHCFLTSSGAMANENALKLAFYNKHPANRILAFERTFAGRTLLLSQITDKPAFREKLPSFGYVDYIPFFNPKYPEESIATSLATLKKLIYRYPKQHAVMCMELVQGEGGFYPGDKEFFKQICQVLKENDIAVFADEVQSFARTPKLFAFQYYELEKVVDLVSIGKLSQVCATLFTDKMKPEAAILSQTFTGSTSAIHAAKVILQNLIQGHFFGEKGKIVEIHDRFAGHLQQIATRYPKFIDGPFGLGAMIAMTPYEGDAGKVAKFAQDLYEAGVIGFVAGSNPTRIRFLPPVGVVTMEDIDAVAAIIEQTVKRP